MLTWRQNVGVPNLTPEKAKQLLKTFNFPTQLDKKGRLVITAGMNRLTLGFKPNGDENSLVGVSRFRLNAAGVILSFVFVLLFLVPALIFIMVIHRKRKRVFLEAIRTMNQTILLQGQVPESPGSRSLVELGNLNEMKERRLITEEEYRKKRDDIISKM